MRYRRWNGIVSTQRVQSQLVLSRANILQSHRVKGSCGILPDPARSNIGTSFVPISSTLKRKGKKKTVYARIRNSMSHIGQISINSIPKIREQSRIDLTNSRIGICISARGYRPAECDPQLPVENGMWLGNRKLICKQRKRVRYAR